MSSFTPEELLVQDLENAFRTYGKRTTSSQIDSVLEISKHVEHGATEKLVFKWDCLEQKLIEQKHELELWSTNLSHNKFRG